MIERTTPWRNIGPVDLRTWQRVIDAAGGLEGLIREEAWAAAGDHSALALAMLRQESSYGTDFDANPASNYNPLNLKFPAGGGYVRFSTWAAGVTGWRQRITSSAYKGGVYARTVSIADLINVYAPPNDQTKTTTEQYITTIVDLMNQWLPGWRPKETEPMAITFGRVPRPAMSIALVNKPVHTGSAYGYDYVPGGRKIVGLVHHETMGRGTGQWYRDFFSCPNGERCRNALVDFLIEKSGIIWMLNDPFGNRAGWANGGGVGEPGGLEGDGPAFYAKFGASGINNRLVSIEYEKLSNENFTESQVQAGGALAAWIHDLDGQRWDEHPFTSKYGCVTSFLHFEFGTTNCGKEEMDDISRVQAVTKGIMKRYQTGEGGSVPIPPDVPPQPPVTIPGGLTLEEAKRRFGKATRYKDGAVEADRFGFDPDGPISLAWAHRAAVEQEWPEIEEWYVLEDSGQALQLVTFSNDWRLVMVHERQGWQWMDYKTITAEAA